MLNLFKPQLIDDVLIWGQKLVKSVASGDIKQVFKNPDLGIVGGFLHKGVPGAVNGGRKFLKTGWESSYGKLWPLIIGMSAYQSVKAPKGQKLNTFVGKTSGELLSAALGAAAFGPLGAFAGMVVGSEKIGGGITRAMNGSQDYLQRRSSLNMGHGFVDFAAAHTMRQVAARDMSTSLLNARQHLGFEAQAFHQ